MKIDLDEVRIRAERELTEERFRAAVAAEKQRMRERKNLSLWQRLTNWLPFTITRKAK